MPYSKIIPEIKWQFNKNRSTNADSDGGKAGWHFFLPLKLKQKQHKNRQGFIMQVWKLKKHCFKTLKHNKTFKTL